MADSLNQLINDGGVCGTAPATPGLLIGFENQISNSN